MKNETIVGYHWAYVNPDGVPTRQQDGAPVGATEEYDGEALPAICEIGLHCSPTLEQSLGYAIGCHLRKVEVSGDLCYGNDKVAGRQRRTLWGVDCTAACIEGAQAVAALAQKYAAIAQETHPTAEQLAVLDTAEADIMAARVEPIKRAVEAAGYTL